MSDTFMELDELERLLAGRGGGGERLIVALAGAPGSGKSTLADDLAARLNARRPESAVVLQMDGFHYDDLYLVPAGLRDRKGAPETFDVGGLHHALLRLRSRDEPFVAVPVFDRTLEVARAGARLVPAEAGIIVVEGNYLLLQRAPWSGLRQFFDIAVLLDVPEPVLRARLEARWQGYGLSADEIARKVDGNDMPNARTVISGSGGEDFRIAGR